MTGIWLDNPNPPSGSTPPNPYPNSSVVVGDPSYFGGDAFIATQTLWTIVNYNAAIATGNGVAIELAVGGNVTNASAGAVIQGRYEGVDLEAGGGNLLNYGIISGYYAAVARPGSSITNKAGGTITGGVDGIFLGSFGYPASGSGAIINYGLIEATGGRGRGNGIVLNVQLAAVTNGGTVIGTGGSNASGLGIAFNYGGYLRNRGTGVIQGYAAGVSADHQTPMTVFNYGTISGTVAGIRVQHAPGTVKNDGTILATSLTSGIGIYLHQGGTVLSRAGAYINGPLNGIEIAGTTGTVSNFGRIASVGGSTGTIFGGIGVLLTAGGAITNDNTSGTSGPRYGIIAGYTAGVDIRGTAGTVTNRGSILASGSAGIGVRLEAGGTVTNRVSGGVTSNISGVAAGIDISGSASTVTNFGTVLANGTSGIGVKLEAGGTVTNRASSGAAGLISAVQTGVDIASGGAGQFSTAANYGTIAATGSNGTGIRFATAGIVLNGTTGAAAAQISAVQAGVDVVGTAGTVANYGTVTATGSSGIGVKLEAGGTLINGATGSSAAQLTGMQAGVSVLGTTGTTANFGTIRAIGTTGTGITFSVGGNVLNGPTGGGSAAILAVQAGVAVSGGTAVPTVTNYGTISATGTAGTGVTLGTSGKVQNGSTQATAALISGVQTGIAVNGGSTQPTVSNYGTISATGTLAVGITLAVGGYLSNGGTQSTAAQIFGSRVGIDISGSSGTVVNFGSIVSNGEGIQLEAGGAVVTGETIANSSTDQSAIVFGTASSIRGNLGGILISGGNGSVANYGSIYTTHGVGVYLGSGGTITNTQRTSQISGGYGGVSINEGTATLVNFGTISGGTYGVGVFRGAYGTITNNQGATIRGLEAIDIGKEQGNTTIVNYGTIISTNGTTGTAIYLGSGNDTVLIGGARSTIVGYVANLHLGDQFVLPNKSGMLAQSGVDAATIGTLNGVPTLQIGTGSGGDPSNFYNIAIKGDASNPALTGDYFKVTQSGTNTLLTLTQGNPLAISVGASIVQQSGITGAGVKIGIISDSFNLLGGAQQDIATGALPADGVQIVREGAPIASLSAGYRKGLGPTINIVGKTDEGRAMAEVIHAIAPGASIAFAALAPPSNLLPPLSFFKAQNQLGSAISDLVAAGCNIIVDDIGLDSLSEFVSSLGDPIGAAFKSDVTLITAGGNNREDGEVIHGHPTDKRELTVTAMNMLAAPNPPAADGGYLTPPKVEPFAEPGATPDKPNVTGPDGGPTALGLKSPVPNSLDPFFGTSAAAPAVAAVAALVLQANPQLAKVHTAIGLNAVDRIIQNTATPFGQGAILMGSGFVQAVQAVGSATQSIALFYQDPQAALSVATAALSQPTGNVAAGTVLEIMLTMNAPVAVTGSPSLVLNDGGTAVYDATISNPATGALTFDYAVGVGDHIPKLLVTGVALNGGSVQDASGNNADFSGLFNIPAGVSIGSPLSVLSIASSQQGEATVGQTIYLTLRFDEAVTVGTAGGPLALSLNNGGTATYDPGLSSPGVGALVFDYTIGNNDNPTPNLSLFDATLPPGTTIQDAAGNNADFTNAISLNTGLQIGPTYVTGFTPLTEGAASTGDQVQLAIGFSSAVNVNTAGGVPTLNLSDGENAAYDAGVSDPGDGILIFDSAVTSQDKASDLTVTGVSLNGATIVDPNGVNVDLTQALNYPSMLSINSPFQATQIATSVTGEAVTGQNVQLTLTMSEPVKVDTLDDFGSQLSLTLNDGGAAAFDLAASNPTAGTLVFDYTVAASDTTSDLSVSQVNLPGPIFADNAGNQPDFSGVVNLGSGLAINIAPAIHGVASDFNDDGTSDILWRHVSGAVAVWEVNNGQAQTSLGIGGASANWSIVSTGDFDGDGTTDILWHDINSGTAAVWEMQNGLVKASIGIGSAPSNWHIVATGDFNGDNDADILWRDANSGSLAIWLMNGTQVVASLDASTATSDWTVIGTGDFDGDGKSDILWRNSNTGTVAIWQMNKGSVQSSTGLGDVGLNWQIQGIGDFNGDGLSDILWRDSTTGTVAVWEMNGSEVEASLGIGVVPSNWQIAGVGDYNHDGKSDILWRDANSGTVAVWEMNGAHVIASVGTGLTSSDWSIVHPNPFAAMSV